MSVAVAVGRRDDVLVERRAVTRSDAAGDVKATGENVVSWSRATDARCCHCHRPVSTRL